MTVRPHSNKLAAQPVPVVAAFMIGVMGIAAVAFACGRSSEPLAGVASSAPTTSPVSTVALSPSPSHQIVSAPEPRVKPMVAYDGTSSKLMLFGGRPATGLPSMLSDTWMWDGNAWALSESAPGPSARAGALATYDPIRRGVVVFGGVAANGDLLSDTWIWSGQSWTSARSGPSPHWLFPGAGTLAFHEERGESILFGNTGAASGPTQGPLTFTWAWNGKWVEKVPSVAPPFRFGAAMAYDANSKRTVLFGGYQSVSPNDRLSDTWTWDGASWVKLRPPTTPSAGPAYAAYDANARKLWLLTLDGAMWFWSNGDWTRQGVFAAMTNRLDATLLFSPAIGRIVLYGGTVVSSSGDVVKNDLWAWDGNVWLQVG